MPVLLGVAALVVVLTGARVVQRRRRDELRTVRSYHERLDTLHVEVHDRGGSVRMVEDADATAPGAAPAVAPPRPRLDPKAARLGPLTPGPLPPDRRGRHDRQWALGRMQPRTTVDTVTIVIAAVVVVVLVGIATAGYLIQRGHGATTTTTTRPSALATGTRAAQASGANVAVKWRSWGGAETMR